MCIFCKIVAGEIPSNKIYEDDFVLAFLDIAPVNYGHVLVISKKHYTNMEEVSEDELCYVMKAVKKIGKKMKDDLAVIGYNVCSNNDPIAGQVIPHLHFHIIPRAENDGLSLWPSGRYGDGEIEEVVSKLKFN